jgi:hypothetical protein
MKGNVGSTFLRKMKGNVGPKLRLEMVTLVKRWLHRIWTPCSGADDVYRNLTQVLQRMWNKRSTVLQEEIEKRSRLSQDFRESKKGTKAQQLEKTQGKWAAFCDPLTVFSILLLTCFLSTYTSTCKLVCLHLSISISSSVATYTCVNIHTHTYHTRICKKVNIYIYIYIRIIHAYAKKSIYIHLYYSILYFIIAVCFPQLCPGEVCTGIL